MLKQLAIVVVGVLVFSLVSAESPSSLTKYVRPAAITELDWRLLQAQVSSFSEHLRWDEYGLVQSVSLFAINERGLVGMTFLVNKQRYIELPDHIVRKVFSAVVVQVSEILKNSIPEIEHGTNVYANFMCVGCGIVRTYEYGQLSVKK